MDGAENEVSIISTNGIATIQKSEFTKQLANPVISCWRRDLGVDWIQLCHDTIRQGHILTWSRRRGSAGAAVKLTVWNPYILALDAWRRGRLRGRLLTGRKIRETRTHPYPVAQCPSYNSPA